MGTLGPLLRAMRCSGAGRIGPNAAVSRWRVMKRFLSGDRTPSPRHGHCSPPWIAAASPPRTRVTRRPASSTAAGSESLPNSAKLHGQGQGAPEIAADDPARDLVVLESSHAEAEEIVRADLELLEDFVSEDEATCLLQEVEDYLEDVEYEYDHWDNAIHGFRETEKSRWTAESKAILKRIRQTAFPTDEQQLSLVHVLDLAKDGYIKPHVDSVKFCGSTIAGLSLLSTSVMRLAKEGDPEHWVQLLLRPRSLYVMKGRARYEFTHEILKDSESVFCGQKLARDRRISIMCRNVPS